MWVFTLPGTCFEGTQTRPSMYVGLPPFTADSTLDSVVSYRLWPPTHSTAIRRISERCTFLSNVWFQIVFTGSNKTYYYSPQTSRREACKLSGGRAYGRYFAWIEWVCIRLECGLNIEQVGTILYTAIFINMIFEPGTSEGLVCMLPSTNTAVTTLPRSKIVRRCLVRPILVSVLQVTR